MKIINGAVTPAWKDMDDSGPPLFWSAAALTFDRRTLYYGRAFKERHEAEGLVNAALLARCVDPDEGDGWHEGVTEA